MVARLLAKQKAAGSNPVVRSKDHARVAGTGRRARLRPGCPEGRGSSTLPLRTQYTESEPAREPGLAANECAASWPWRSSRPLSAEGTHPAVHPVSKTGGGQRWPRGSTPLPSSIGHSHTGCEGLPDKQDWLGSTPRWPTMTGQWPSRSRHPPYKREMRRFKPCLAHEPVAQRHERRSFKPCRPGFDPQPAHRLPCCAGYITRGAPVLCSLHPQRHGARRLPSRYRSLDGHPPALTPSECPSHFTSPGRRHPGWLPCEWV